MPRPTLLDRLGFTSEAEFYASLRRGGPVAPEPATPCPEPAHPPELLARVRLEVRAMTSCPYRGRKIECGCRGARLCHLGRGDSGRVTALDCQRCPVAMVDLLGSTGRQLPNLVTDSSAHAGSSPPG